jgi:hypothetical protein
MPVLSKNSALIHGRLTLSTTNRSSGPGFERFRSAPASQRPGGLDAEPEGEESLVTDVRADLTPAQMVERKLFSLLKEKPVPISYLRMANVTRGRGVS